jgi:hypothetical protein
MLIGLRYINFKLGITPRDLQLVTSQNYDLLIWHCILLGYVKEGNLYTVSYLCAISGNTKHY